MADPKILIRRSSTPNKVPTTTNLQLGELAINTFDGKLYLERDQTSGSGIATVIAVNPWNVGVGSLAYDTYFAAGNVGINTTNPTQLLDVAGDIRLRGAIYDSLNSTGSSNQVLVSNAGAGVTWTTLSAIPVGDANTLDGLDSTQFLRSDDDDVKTGITTFSDTTVFDGDVELNGNITTNVTIVSTDAGSAAAPEFKLYRNSASPADADYIGQIKFAGESDTGVERNYAKITGKIGDATNGTEDGIIEIAHIKDGSQNISGRWNSTTLQLINGTGLSVNGDATFESNVYLGNDDNLYFGASNELRIYHNSSFNNSIIYHQDTAGTLSFRSNSGVINFYDYKNARWQAKFDEDVIELNYSGSKVFETIGYGVSITGGGYYTGIVTASSFVKEGGTSSQFLKADGSVDTNTYLTAEAQSLDGVLGLGNTSSLGMDVGIVTATAFVGDGSGLTNLPGASLGISTNTVDQSQLITFATGYGSTTGLGATDGLVYNPSSGRLGIGSATPAYPLDVAGDINSSTDVKINGTGVLDTALALAIALG